MQPCPQCKIGSLELKDGKYQCNHCHYEQRIKSNQKPKSLVEELDIVDIGGCGYSGTDDSGFCE